MLKVGKDRGKKKKTRRRDKHERMGNLQGHDMWLLHCVTLIVQPMPTSLTYTIRCRFKWFSSRPIKKVVGEYLTRWFAFCSRIVPLYVLFSASIKDTSLSEPIRKLPKQNILRKVKGKPRCRVHEVGMGINPSSCQRCWLC